MHIILILVIEQRVSLTHPNRIHVLLKYPKAKIRIAADNVEYFLESEYLYSAVLQLLLEVGLRPMEIRGRWILVGQTFSKNS